MNGIVSKSTFVIVLFVNKVVNVNNNVNNNNNNLNGVNANVNNQQNNNANANNNAANIILAMPGKRRRKRQTKPSEDESEAVTSEFEADNGRTAQCSSSTSGEAIALIYQTIKVTSLTY